MIGMTNELVQKIGEKISNNFLGVFPSDVLLDQIEEMKKRKKWSTIVNLSPSSQSGSHFVAIVRNEGQLFYFDSFGFSPYQKYVVKTINDLMQDQVSIYFWPRQIQSFHSDMCGFFTLFFISTERENQMFHLNNLRMNDLICFHGVQDILSKL